MIQKKHHHRRNYDGAYSGLCLYEKGCTYNRGSVHILMILELLLHPEAEEVDDTDGHDCYGSCLAHGV